MNNLFNYETMKKCFNTLMWRFLIFSCSTRLSRWRMALAFKIFSLLTNCWVFCMSQMLAATKHLSNSDPGLGRIIMTMIAPNNLAWLSCITHSHQSYDQTTLSPQTTLPSQTTLSSQTLLFILPRYALKNSTRIFSFNCEARLKGIPKMVFATADCVHETNILWWCVLGVRVQRHW